MKKNINIKRFISIFLTIGAIIMMTIITYYVSLPSKQSPKAVKGTLDLTSWDFKRDGITFLNGEWDFYPERLLNSKELESIAPNPIKVPGNWREKKGYLQPARGSGTYHLSITLPNKDGGYILKVQNIWMCHRLFINGALVKEMGIPAYKHENHQSKNTPYLVRIEPTDKLDIVIQVSNHMFYEGGIIQPIQLGDENTMERKAFLSFGSDMAGFFLCILFAIYHLHLYQMRDKEITYLYSGLYLILLSFMIITSGEKLFMRVMEEVPFQVAYKLQDFTIALSFPVLLLLIRSLEKSVIKKKTLKFIMIPVVLYLLLMILTPYHFYIGIKVYISLYLDIVLFVFIFRMIFILLYNRERTLPLNEFFYVIASVTFIAITFFDAALHYSAYLNTNVIGRLSILGFLMSLNALLARRFTNKMNEVQVLSQELKKSNEIKDEFLARTSHEIKTPLNGIINISSYLLKERDPSLTLEQRENIHLMQDTAIKTSLLVNDLIDAIKLRHEDMQININTVDLYVVTEVVFQLLSFDIKEKKLKLTNLIKPMTFAEADENRLRQILYNIISNAIKYTDNGEIVAKAKVEEENIKVIISDTGVGIPPYKWELVFQDSYMKVSAEELSHNSMGLGLYISRELARRMKGEVWIDNSAVGEGTEIALRLLKGHLENYSVEKIENGIRDKEELKEVLNKKGDKPSKKILVVDDEPTNVRILSLMLKEEFEVLKAYGGEEALRILQNEKVNLVITDTMMPGMSGIELTQRIRSTHSVIKLPIIVATTRYDHRDIELAYQSGANDYITKPFSEEEIQCRVRILIQLTEAMDNALKNQIAFLQAQIKPHFIYNALSNIIALCYEDGEKAAELLILLSRYLRYIFQTDQSRQMIPLKQELDIIKAYVEIEKLRFGNRLKYKTYIDSSIYDSNFMIPILLIQPLVENAIRHGIFNKEGLGTVTLTITEGEDFIRIVVEDDGIGMSDDEVYQIMNNKEAKGVGIKNIRKRVESFHDAAFSIDSDLEKGTRCSLFLPKAYENK